MIKNKAVYILIGLIIVLTFILFIKISTSSSPPPPQGGKPTEVVHIIDTNLKSSEERGTDFIIQLKFDKPVSEDSISISLNPHTPFVTSLDQSSTVVLIKAKDSWVFRTNYLLQVSTKGDKISLDKTYSYPFKTVPYQGI